MSGGHLPHCICLSWGWVPPASPARAAASVSWPPCQQVSSALSPGRVHCTCSGGCLHLVLGPVVCFSPAAHAATHPACAPHPVLVMGIRHRGPSLQLWLSLGGSLCFPNSVGRQRVPRGCGPCPVNCGAAGCPLLPWLLFPLTAWQGVGNLSWLGWALAPGPSSGLPQWCCQCWEQVSGPMGWAVCEVAAPH